MRSICFEGQSSPGSLLVCLRQRQGDNFFQWGGLLVFVSYGPCVFPSIQARIRSPDYEPRGGWILQTPPGMFEYIFEDTLQLQIDMGHLLLFLVLALTILLDSFFSLCFFLIFRKFGHHPYSTWVFRSLLPRAVGSGPASQKFWGPVSLPCLIEATHSI